MTSKKDFFSPKNIANRQKSKGLQKLRWYCQLCQKQCRDDVRLVSVGLTLPLVLFIVRCRWQGVYLVLSGLWWGPSRTLARVGVWRGVVLNAHQDNPVPV